MIKDVTSGAGVKNALKSGAKRAGKSILKRGTQGLMKGKGPRKRKHDPLYSIESDAEKYKQRKM